MKKKNIKKELTKARKFKNATPGQNRDFETLDANRMFKAYEDVEVDEGSLSPDQKKKREVSRERTHSGHKSYRQAHDADRGQKKPDRNVRKYWEPAPSMRAGPKGKLPEEVEIDEKLTPDQRRKREGMRTASQPKAGRKSGTMMPARGDFSKTYDRDKQFRKNIGPQGTPAGIAAHKAARGVKKVKGAKEETTHFGDVLRQAIEEAKKVNAIDTINKIVKTKTMGKLHGQKVDLFTASAIQQVYNALNKKNQAKMVSVMSKDVHGLLKMADFSMSKMKR